MCGSVCASLKMCTLAYVHVCVFGGALVVGSEWVRKTGESV